MPYSPILATLGYVMSPDRSQVLLIHRNKNPQDNHFGKYNGLGGKLENNEDIVSCICREVKEEAGLEVVSPILRGTVSWPGFGKKGVDWFGFIFRIDSYTGTLFTESHEGTLEWVDLVKIPSLPMWEGDPYFLPLVFENSAPFHGIMPYEGGRPLSWSYRIA